MTTIAPRRNTRQSNELPGSGLLEFLSLKMLIVALILAASPHAAIQRFHQSQ
jgi:hypothetical protein